MYTSRASSLTGTGLYCLQSLGEEFIHLSEGLFGQSHASWDAIIDKDRGCLQVGMVRLGYPAQIIAIGQDQERHKSDHCMFQGVDAAHKMQFGRFNPFPDARADR
jgi:hypothetical protein